MSTNYPACAHCLLAFSTQIHLSETERALFLACKSMTGTWGRMGYLHCEAFYCLLHYWIRKVNMHQIVSRIPAWKSELPSNHMAPIQAFVSCGEHTSCSEDDVISQFKFAFCAAVNVPTISSWSDFKRLTHNSSCQTSLMGPFFTGQNTRKCWRRNEETPCMFIANVLSWKCLVAKNATILLCRTLKIPKHSTYVHILCAVCPYQCFEPFWFFFALSHLSNFESNLPVFSYSLFIRASQPSQEHDWEQHVWRRTWCCGFGHRLHCVSSTFTASHTSPCYIHLYLKEQPGSTSGIYKNAYLLHPGHFSLALLSSWKLHSQKMWTDQSNVNKDYPV